MKRVIMYFATLTLLAVCLADSAVGQTKPKDPQWTHAFDLACRKFGEAEFTPSTQKFGVEALRDSNVGLGMYVTEKGTVALASGFDGLAGAASSKSPIWITGLDLPARKAGESDFNKAKTYCLEIFRDPHTDNAVFITSDGRIAAASAKGKILSGNKTPKCIHSVDLNVRKGGEKEWKNPIKVGVEVYRDENTGNLIYITDSGAITVVADKGSEAPKGDVKAPAWLHGLDLVIRKQDEATFTNDTRRFGVEVFRDEQNGNIIYICESGAIAVVPGGEKLSAPTANVKEPAWSHGWNVKARKYGEKDFSNRTTVYGGEVFRDDNTGTIIALSETGAISAIKP